MFMPTLLFSMFRVRPQRDFGDWTTSCQAREETSAQVSDFERIHRVVLLHRPGFGKTPESKMGHAGKRGTVFNLSDCMKAPLRCHRRFFFSSRIKEGDRKKIRPPDS
jgi:hypothetical protein